MEEDVIEQIQQEGADALPDVGVSVPLKALHTPLRKRSVGLRVTMKQPYLSGQTHFTRIYLSMGVMSEQMRNFGKGEEMEFMAGHDKKISHMIAYTICHGWWGRHLLLWPVSWFVYNFMEQFYLLDAVKRFMSLMGADPFISTIRSAEMANPMKLRLSQKRGGS